MDIDWQKACCQILRTLRGKRSQNALSRRLGYRSNVACDWEAGRRVPTAGETLRAYSRLGIDVQGAFRAFQPACARSLGKAPEFQVHRWLRDLAGGLTVAELAVRAGLSRSAVGRWLNGKTRPRLHHFLALVEAICGRASDLVDALVPIAGVPELQSVHARRAAAKKLAFVEPWSAAVMRIVETVDYQKGVHQSGYIAARLGLTEEKEAELLHQLVAAGVLQFENDRYQAGEPLTVDTQASAEEVRAVRTHWTEVCLDRVQEPRGSDWLGFNVISTSAADMHRVKEILRSAFREIRALSAASEPTESVALLNMQFVTMNDSED